VTTLRTLLIVLLCATPAFPDSSVAGDPLVVCLGDSLTEGYQVDPVRAYPAVVQSRLRERGWRNLEVVNAGISGSTIASAVSRLRWQLRRKPNVLILALGANDGLRGVAPETTKANLAEAIDLAQSEEITVLLAGMKLPPNYGNEHTQAFEQVFTQLAADKDVALIPFLLAGVATDPKLNQP